MPKLYAATGGKPQHWETLDNLGAVQADAPAIVYAVEMGWILVAPKHDPHSMSLIEAGRRSGQKAGRPPPFDTIGKGSREGSGRPVDLNTARCSS
jgi:hypothetical protein